MSSTLNRSKVFKPSCTPYLLAHHPFPPKTSLNLNSSRESCPYKAALSNGSTFTFSPISALSGEFPPENSTGRKKIIGFRYFTSKPRFPVESAFCQILESKTPDRKSTRLKSSH